MKPGSPDDVEDRVATAAAWYREGLSRSVPEAARHFDGPRDRLKYRLAGRQPKKGRPATNTTLTKAQEVALCRYIDRLDYVNLAALSLLRPQQTRSC
ncbi:hypothetical protein B0T24DRAFT_113166 [Lasiosphaeria ovina]|uniref:Uncharacterized protein n=1 Tax=Lasiosphaeria ovina TaxID=92902 RepID=A0AAE0JV21_9PEZI|nr:hypothetical protein B0T24DRAFT_113166 [Lasiosphaeria ovina]